MLAIKLGPHGAGAQGAAARSLGSRHTWTMTQRANVARGKVEAELVEIQDALQGLVLDSREAAKSRAAAQEAAGSDKVELLVGEAGQDRVVELLEKFKGQVWMTAFTFDEPSIVKAVKDHSEKHVGVVRLLVDGEKSKRPEEKKANEAICAKQNKTLQQLAAAGVQCQLICGKEKEGTNFCGHQHSKSIYLKGDPGKTSYLVGSSNWTTSSRSNIELGVLTSGASESKYFRDYEEFYEGLWEKALAKVPQVDPMKLAA